MYYFFFERRNQHSHVMGSITPISFNTCQHPPHWISDMTFKLLDSPSTCRIKADAKYAHMYMKMYLFVFACICLVFVHICFVFVSKKTEELLSRKRCPRVVGGWCCPKLVLKWQIDAKTSASGRLLWQFFRNLKQKSDVGRKGPWPFYRNLTIVFFEGKKSLLVNRFLECGSVICNQFIMETV